MNNKVPTNKFKCTLILLFALLTNVQAQGRKLSKENLAGLYAENNFTSAEWVTYHKSDSITTIFAKIHLQDFIYRHAWNDNGKSQAHFKIHYILMESYESNDIIDSASFFYTDSLHFGEEMGMVVKFDVHAAYPGDYIMKIRLTDLNSNFYFIDDFIPLYKHSHFSSQNFLITDAKGLPLFNPYFNKGRKFKIQFNDSISRSMDVRYYNRDFPLAKPPFAINRRKPYTFQPDSFYTVKLENGITSLLEFPNTGIYFIQPDSERPEGITLFRFGNGFPEVNSPWSAIEPLRYLTTEPEFAYLKSYSNYKTAIDSFWLDRASYDPERAKKMIRRYYSRVERANELFTSYQEGWKTDRGLIYIIYGPPSEVYRKSDEEEWIYGERGNPLSIRFFFDKVENPFTENDFSLQRSSVYKTSWYIAIENWRR